MDPNDVGKIQKKLSFDVILKRNPSFSTRVPIGLKKNTGKKHQQKHPRPPFEGFRDK